MRYLQKLPLLFALVAALMAGLIGFLCSKSQNEVLLQMILVMVTFYIIGFITRSTCMDIQQELDKKRKEKEQEELKKQQEEEQKAKEAKREAGILGKNIDFTAGNVDEDAFAPLPVSEFIKSELKS